MIQVASPLSCAGRRLALRSRREMPDHTRVDREALFLGARAGARRLHHQAIFPLPICIIMSFFQFWDRLREVGLWNLHHHAFFPPVRLDERRRSRDSREDARCASQVATRSSQVATPRSSRWRGHRAAHPRLAAPAVRGRAHVEMRCAWLAAFGDGRHASNEGRHQPVARSRSAARRALAARRSRPRLVARCGKRAYFAERATRRAGRARSRR